MVKSDEDVIADFNRTVNMTADELEKWLQSSSSHDSGKSKDDGSGESVGHDSGRKIVDILRRNPNKDPAKYEDKDLAHMGRVAAYNKRHLAQEEQAKRDTDSNSYKSLKNWGHDAQKS